MEKLKEFILIEKNPFFTLKYKKAFLGFLSVCFKAQGFFSILTAVAFAGVFQGEPQNLGSAPEHLRGAGHSFTEGLQFKREKGH